jgi:integral membrane sensor domain MASE1
VDLRYLIRAALMAVAYVVLAKVGLSLAEGVKQITAVWPPSGFSLVILLVLGYRYWPAIFIGALFVNWTTNEPALVALGVALGNTLEALTGTFLLKRFAKFSNQLARPRDLVAFGIAGILCTVVAASIGPMALALGGVIAWSKYWSAAILWWQGDMMGVLLVGPMLLAFLTPKTITMLRGRIVESLVLLAAVFGVSYVVFCTRVIEPLGFPYLVMPLLVWAALRFTQLGVATASLVIATTAVWATAHGMGPFSIQGAFEQDLTQLQLFLVVTSSTALFLAASIGARMTAEDALRLQAKELERLDADLKEANRRVTNILAGILDEGSKRRSAGSAHNKK